MAKATQILIVEDEPALSHMLKATLEYGGYDSDTSSSALGALQRLTDAEYDAVLLDLGLPDMDGAHLVKTIRGSSHTPIIVVSARGSEHDKIAAFDYGADDFVEKPFLPGELLARLRAVLRRRGTPAPSDGSMVGNKASGGAASGVDDIQLAPMEQKLLKLLSSKEGEVTSSEEIIASVWGPRKERGSGHVRVLVAQLRRKLKAQGEPVEISNERGAGYRLLKRELAG